MSDFYETFFPQPSIDAAIAQLAEHPLSKRKVVGSTPTGGFFCFVEIPFLYIIFQSILIKLN